MLIDVHNHLPVSAGHTDLVKAKNNFLADMGGDGVDYAVLIPDNIPNSPLGDTNSCLRLVENEPKIFLMGTIDIQNQGEVWIARLDALAQEGRIVGMKIFPGHDPIYPTDPRLDPVYNLCQRRHMPMMIHTGWNSSHPEVAQYNDPKYIVQVARQYPDMKIVIAHYFWPEVDYCYELTHPYSNIYYDTSGLADNEVITVTGLGRIRSVLVKTLSTNPERVLFGTDYAMCSRKAHVELVEGLPVEPEVREKIFWRNVVKLYKLEVDLGD
jgi:uncharacterized protein